MQYLRQYCRLGVWLGRSFEESNDTNSHCVRNTYWLVCLLRTAETELPHYQSQTHAVDIPYTSRITATAFSAMFAYDCTSLRAAHAPYLRYLVVSNAAMDWQWRTQPARLRVHLLEPPSCVMISRKQ